MPAAVIACTVGVFLALYGQAIGRSPDLSGQWKLSAAVNVDDDKQDTIRFSRVSGAGFNCDRECTLTQTAKTLTVSLPPDAQGKKPADVVLNLGADSAIPQRGGEYYVDTRWDGDTLVVVRSVGELETTQRIGLGDGRLVVTTFFAAITKQSPVRQTYVRK
jgi:hypothetical protein